jgi:hypothetical protein
MSIKVKRRRIAEKEKESWTPEQQAAEESRVLKEKLEAAAAEKLACEETAAEKAEQERTVRVHEALRKLKEAGCTSTYQFFEDFFASTDREVSRQASRLMSEHGTDLLDLLHAKRPDVAEKWALKVSLPVIAAEGRQLSELLRPDKTKSFTSRLEKWSLEKMLTEATIAAPNLCELLALMGMTSDVGRQDNKLVGIAAIHGASDSHASYT